MEDIEWINWTDHQHIFTLQYPSLDYWKIIEEGNQNNSNLSHDLRDSDKEVNDDNYDIAILHIDNGVTNVKIAFNAIPIKDISNRNGFPLFKSYFSYSDLLVEHLRLDKKSILLPHFKLLKNIQTNI